MNANDKEIPAPTSREPVLNGPLLPETTDEGLTDDERVSREHQVSGGARVDMGPEDEERLQKWRR
jgi:hypothetical protein